ncbi:MAG: phosphatidylinositol diacylglycerol-lyase [Myxococcales bacterium]|nr:phosphatidylinositol diacylglycerol-lyase [Myxococcales bacterium]
MLRQVSRQWLAAVGLALAACTGDAHDESDWMSRVTDMRYLTELSIPGTHDAGARFEPYPGLSKAQELTIAQQLAAGVRFFDIRCRHVDNQFLIYHGAIDQNQTFDEVLATMFGFLDAHPKEALIVSIKEESVASGATRTFEETFATYVAQARDRWFLEAGVPLLGDARGKLVLLRRFPATSLPLGIDASPWADNATFSIANAASLRVQDAYKVSDDASKWTAIASLLAEPGAGNSPTLFLDFTSGYQTIMGLPNITSVSDDINPRLDTLLADPATANLGVLVMDFVTAPRAAAIVSTNLR